MKEANPILDQYECKECDNTLSRRATPTNILHSGEVEVKFCPFCGKKYE